MKSPTFVFIICSAGARVGKTTMARLLADYFILSQRQFAGFDTHSYEPEFAERFPRQVAVVDLNSVQGQMALFDPLLVHDEVPKIIDLWHHTVDAFFTLWDHMDFAAEARRIGVEPIVFLFAEPSPRSLAIASHIVDRHPDLTMIAVNNEGTLLPGGIGRDELARCRAGRTFTMGRLDPILRGVIEVQSFSFSRFMLAPPFGMSIVVRACLKSWILQMVTQLQSLELSMMLELTEHLG